MTPPSVPPDIPHDGYRNFPTDGTPGARVMLVMPDRRFVMLTRASLSSRLSASAFARHSQLTRAGSGSASLFA
ncbi:hypothetical protein AURDEDRAFT_109507 [Auricularia subglabra TFB-10046 SS5]|nr:hypothetical protein AURDEDRAFT_109507 [Auricularia subglabra TFB-10046 SS5]